MITPEERENPKAFAFGIGTDNYDMQQHGMDLRDYFAAKAMQSIVNIEYGSNLDAIAWAKYSYAIADAMMK